MTMENPNIALFFLIWDWKIQCNKKSGQYWGPRLHDVTARLANRTKFVVPRLNRLKIAEVIPIFFLYWPIAW